MIESLVDLYLITEYKGGAVYRTKFVSRVWVVADEAPPLDHQFVALSMAYLRQNPDLQTVRLRRPR